MVYVITMASTPAERFARFIEDKRLRKGEVAEAIGCSRQWLHSILTEGKDPSLPVAVGIEDLMKSHGAEKPIDPREWVAPTPTPHPAQAEAVGS